MTYLSPVQTPILKYEIFFEIFKKSLDLAEKVNMKYAHKILNVGAAMKAYHIVWNCQEK